MLADNPIFEREGWPGRWHHRSAFVRGLLVSAFVGAMFGLAALSGWGLTTLGRETGGQWTGGVALSVLVVIVNLKWWAVRLLAAILPAIAIAQERERLTWDSIVLTRLTPRDLLLGKCAAHLVPCVWIAVFFLPTELVLLRDASLLQATVPELSQVAGAWLPGAPLPIGWLVESGLQLLTTLAYAAIGLLWSVLSRRALHAVVGSLASVIVLGVFSSMISVGLLALFGYLGEMFDYFEAVVSSGGSRPPAAFESAAMDRATQLFIVYRAALSIGIIAVLWRVMMVRFRAWDQRMRGTATAAAGTRRAPA